jgi:putative ABC transport system permease protein
MFLFRLKRTFKLGTKSLWLHRLRSTLTTLGIVFGVCSVIAMLAIGEGASEAAQDAIRRLGSTNLIIETVKPPQEQTDAGSVEAMNKYGLTYDDAECIRNTIPGTQVIVPIREINQEARYLTRQNVAVKIVGTIPWYTEISPVRLIRGRFLSSTDMRYSLSVCVIDEQVARELFLFDDPLGKDVRVYGSYYRVVGIVAGSPAAAVDVFSSNSAEQTTNSGGVTGNIYIPVTTAKSRFPEISYIWSGGSESLERVELQKITVKVGSVDSVLAVRNIIDALLQRLHKDKQDYRIVVPLELLRHAARTRRIFSIVLGSIAAISLLVGGIGIMNIMLATVSERTREIGIRRALGAKKRDIIIQFLSETLLLTFLGGILGVILGSVIPSLVSRYGNMPTIITGWSLVLAFGISAAVGIVFGLYPAWRAANMDPIESLRHE